MNKLTVGRIEFAPLPAPKDRQVTRALRESTLAARPLTSFWGSTHHETCWREHLGCAIRRVERLELLLGQERVKNKPSESEG